MDYKTREKLEKDIMLGNHAESCQFIIDTISESLIEQVKNDFIKLPIINYQNIDNREIFVLKLKVEVIKDFQNHVKALIRKGLEARHKLNGENDG